MKKAATTLLLIPFALLGGLPYGLIADRIFREREPWFTLCMLCGLGVTVCAMTWLGGTSPMTAAWVFAGTGALFVALRLLFGSGSAFEMFFVTHILAVLSLLLPPAFAHVREKTGRSHGMRPNQSTAASVLSAVRLSVAGNLSAPCALPPPPPSGMVREI